MNVRIIGFKGKTKKKILEALEKVSFEKIYCTSETCLCVTHPRSRMELTRGLIYETMAKMGITNFSLRKTGERAICFDIIIIESS